MLDRRVFILGSCFAAPAFLYGVARAQGRQFICGTVDRPPPEDTQLQLDQYSAEAGIDRDALERVVQEFELTPYGTAYLPHRWRRGDGLTPNTGLITLGVHFLDGSEASKATVRRAALAWLTGELRRRMAFRFDVPRRQAQITITFNTDRDSSVVGRESAKYTQTHPTMHLAHLDDHIIQHEFGHALGLQHEHQHPGGGIRWKRASVIADMAKQKWTEDMVQKNIFDRYSTRYACVGDRAFNPDSIMLYPIPSDWTENRFSSGVNTAISERDLKCVAGLYRV